MIGFIGAGNMGSAILHGILAAKIASPSDIYFSRTNETAGRELAQKTGTSFIRSNRKLIEAVGSGIVILGVKPAVMPSVLKEIREPAAKAGTTLVSLAAGTTLASITSYLDAGQPVVRAMPNVCARIGLGVTALCSHHAVSSTQFEEVRAIFNAVGTAIELEEKDFSAFTAIAGSSPAWTFQYIDSLARGALAAGMHKDDALRAAAGAVLGAAQLVLDSLESDIRPQALIDTVTSPGGTTIAGLIAAEEEGFSRATLAAVAACIDRDQEIADA